MQNTSARNNSLKMELIIIASQYQAKGLIFYVHFLKKNFLFTWGGRSGVAFLSYEKVFGGEKFRGLRGRPQGLLGSTRSNPNVIVVAFNSPPLLVADSLLFFITLICANGPFKVHKRSSSAGWSISDGP